MSVGAIPIEAKATLLSRHCSSTGRSPSTVCRELQRNQMSEGIYLPDTAQLKMQQQRQSAKTAFEQISQEILAQVKARLHQYHNLQQIAGRLQREAQQTVSHETIYQMIYRDYEELGGYAQYLRQSHIRRQKRETKQCKQGIIPHRVGIEQRSSIAEEKTQIGHWEGNTIIGRNHMGAIAPM